MDFKTNTFINVDSSFQIAETTFFSPGGLQPRSVEEAFQAAQKAFVPPPVAIPEKPVEQELPITIDEALQNAQEAFNFQVGGGFVQPMFAFSCDYFDPFNQFDLSRRQVQALPASIHPVATVTDFDQLHRGVANRMRDLEEISCCSCKYSRENRLRDFIVCVNSHIEYVENLKDEASTDLYLKIFGAMKVIALTWSNNIADRSSFVEILKRGILAATCIFSSPMLNQDQRKCVNQLKATSELLLTILLGISTDRFEDVQALLNQAKENEADQLQYPCWDQQRLEDIRQSLIYGEMKRNAERRRLVAEKRARIKEQAERAATMKRLQEEAIAKSKADEVLRKEEEQRVRLARENTNAEAKKRLEMDERRKQALLNEDRRKREADYQRVQAEKKRSRSKTLEESVSKRYKASHFQTEEVGDDEAIALILNSIKENAGLDMSNKLGSPVNSPISSPKKFKPGSINALLN